MPDLCSVLIVIASISLQFPRSVGGVDTAVIKDRNISEPLQYLSVGTDAEVDNEATRDTLQLSANDGVNARRAEKDVIASNLVKSSTNDGVKERQVAKDTSSSVSLLEANGGNVKDTYITKDTTGTKPLQSSTGEGVKDVVASNEALAPEPIGIVIYILYLD